MARSRTTFKPGNTAGAQPGNKLARRHGAYERELLAPQAAAIEARLVEELTELPQTRPVDRGLVEIHAFMEAAAKVRMDYARRTGGLWTSRGNLKKGGREFFNLVYRIHESAKVLGIGAAPRAAMYRDQAGAGKDALVIKAAQDRLREKYLTN